MLNTRRLVALLCLAVMLYAVLTPAAPGLLPAILAPVWFFVAAIVVFSARVETDGPRLRPVPFLPVLAPRAPPNA